VPAATVPAVLGSMLDILFPRRCVACAAPGWPFCARCSPAVGMVSLPWCERCGRPFDAAVATCRDCPPPPISWARSAFLYDGPVRRGVMRLKFGGARVVAEAFAGPMAAVLGAELSRAPPTGRVVVTWVPLAARRKRLRGYDQAELLARQVARRAGLPAARLLRRTRETPPQARRQGADRHEVMTGSFSAVAGARVPPDVILVDDVLTSGATAAGCVRALLLGGARTVAVLTAARSLGGAIPSRCYTAAPGPDLGLWLPGGSSPGSRCQSQAKRPT